MLMLDYDKGIWFSNFKVKLISSLLWTEMSYSLNRVSLSDGRLAFIRRYDGN